MRDPAPPADAKVEAAFEEARLLIPSLKRWGLLEEGKQTPDHEIRSRLQLWLAVAFLEKTAVLRNLSDKESDYLFQLLREAPPMLFKRGRRKSDLRSETIAKLVKRLTSPPFDLRATRSRHKPKSKPRKPRKGRLTACEIVSQVLGETQVLGEKRINVSSTGVETIWRRHRHVSDDLSVLEV